jgi:hypothetical protein
MLLSVAATEEDLDVAHVLDPPGPTVLIAVVAFAPGRPTAVPPPDLTDARSLRRRTRTSGKTPDDTHNWMRAETVLTIGTARRRPDAASPP